MVMRDVTMTKKNEPKFELKPGKFSMGMIIGAGIGAALGVAMDSIGVGVGIGAGIGTALGIGFSQSAKSKDDPDA